MRGFGWHEGRNLIVERRYTEGRGERLTEITTEFVRLKVDVILTWTNAGALAAQRVTQSLPIVALNVVEPIEIWSRKKSCPTRR